jgi:SAM-dependent methyltransferase
MNSSSYKDSHINRGIDYHNKFKDESLRKWAWDFEKQILKKHVTIGKNVLDIATGTGRIAVYLSEMDSSIKLTGVDISDNMLEVARSHGGCVNFIKADITNENIPFETKFDVITAFRFFPNADIDLTKKVIRNTAKYIVNDGVFIFNNHRSLESLTSRLKRFMRKKGGVVGSYDRDLLDHFHDNGFSVIKVYSISIFPFGYEPYGVFRHIVHLIEVVNFKVFSKYHRIGNNNVYILRKKNK